MLSGLILTRLSSYYPNLPICDVQMCHIHCNVRGAFYMATQYGTECWCSRAQDLDYASVDVGVCDMECSGDAVSISYFELCIIWVVSLDGWVRAFRLLPEVF